MADCCRPEVDNDVISCRKVKAVDVVHILNFGDPSLSRLGAIRKAHFVTTTATTEYAYYPINAQPKGLGLKQNSFKDLNEIFSGFAMKKMLYSEWLDFLSQSFDVFSFLVRQRDIMKFQQRMNVAD
jgi:hypothetical protein